MNTNKSLIDIVFNQRNKEYGAYELRMNYSKRIKRALLVTFGLTGGIISLFAIGKESDSNNSVYISNEITIAEVKEPEVKTPPPPTKQIETTAPSVVKFTAPIIVAEPLDTLPAQIDLRGSQIGTFDRTGDTCRIAPIPDIDGGTGIIEGPAEGNEVFERVEIEAEFPGGINRWRQYLERNLKTNDEAPEGIYTVLIQFIVDSEGGISEVTALTNHGYGMETEAIRVIQKGPKWKPAIQNGRQVKAYRRQPITFQVVY